MTKSIKILRVKILQTCDNLTGLKKAHRLTFHFLHKTLLCRRQVGLQREELVENVDHLRFEDGQLRPEPGQEVDRLLARAADRDSDAAGVQQVLDFGLGQTVTAGKNNNPGNEIRAVSRACKPKFN